MRSGISAALALLTVTAPAAAEPAPYTRALAAGYKALTLCGAIFNGHRTQAEAEALELKGIYPELDQIVPELAATVTHNGYAGSVAVPFDKALPPRFAIWRWEQGCVTEPIGRPVMTPVLNFIAAPKGPEATDGHSWPMGDVAALQPAKTLRPVTVKAFDATTYGRDSQTTAVVVVRNGQIVAEQYRDGFDFHTAQRTWSVAKSLSGTLVGIAGVDPAKPAPVPEWQAPGDPRMAIKLDNLMRMASGLHSETAGNRTDAIYFGGTAVTEQATGWPLDASPGTRFRYANDDILLAVRALRASLGDPLYAGFPKRALFDRIGMTRTIAETDWQGNYVLSSQVWSTARDLARFGLLYLDDGVWNGQRILPEGWVKYVTSPSGPQPDGAFGYGATFWLINKSPGVPADTFAAIGNRGQYVVIVPSRKIVIVRRGEDPAGASFDIAKFTADVVAALK
ncbi:MAG: serine hydrolase [Sphingomonadaceae bacterium]|nr:serine hydrolase [Sphingomonadaceae bacterium]